MRFGRPIGARLHCTPFNIMHCARDIYSCRTTWRDWDKRVIPLGTKDDVQKSSRYGWCRYGAPNRRTCRRMAANDSQLRSRPEKMSSIRRGKVATRCSCMCTWRPSLGLGKCSLSFLGRRRTLNQTFSPLGKHQDWQMLVCLPATVFQMQIGAAVRPNH